MKFTQFWPLAFLILIPVIIIMYLMKQKAKDQTVSSLYLWSEMVKNTKANTPWDKLKRDWLLILQIITTIVLIVALMSPFVMSNLAASDKACIVIDTSASMNFMYDDEMTRLDKAKEEAIAYVRTLKNGGEISLITSDRSAMLLSSKIQSKSEIIDQIKSIEPSNYAGDTTEGVKMANALATDSKDLEVMIFTDSSIEVQGINATVLDVYSERPNVGIDYVSHGTDSKGKLTILIKVTNYSDSDVTRDVSLYCDDELITFKEVEIKAGSSDVVYFENPALTSDIYSAQLSVKDACLEDNIVYDILEEENESKILLMTRANIYLEKALNLILNVTVTKSAEIEHMEDLEKLNYDLYIFDSMLPDKLPAEGNIMIFGMPVDDIARRESVYTEGRYITGVDSKVTKYLEGLSFGVGETYTYNIEDNKNAEAFLVTSTDGGEEEVVAFMEEKNGRNYCVVGFDLHNSELPLYMEYPILMYNIVASCVESGSLSNYVYNGGDMVNISANVEGELPVVVKPDGTEVETSDFITNFSSTNQYGAYTLKQKVKDTENNYSFVVNYPAAESKITMHPTLTATENDNIVTEVKGILNLRNLIIIIAMLLLTVEWIAGLKR